MKRKKLPAPITWILWLMCCIGCFWLSYKSNQVPSGDDIAPTTHYVYERDVTAEVAVSRFDGNVYFHYNGATYNGTKDFDDFQLLLEKHEEINSDLSKKEDRYLIYNRSQQRFTERIESIEKDFRLDKKRKKQATYSSIAFMFVSVPLFAIGVLLTIVLFATFFSWIDDVRKWLKKGCLRSRPSVSLGRFFSFFIGILFGFSYLSYQSNKLCCVAKA